MSGLCRIGGALFGAALFSASVLAEQGQQGPPSAKAPGPPAGEIRIIATGSFLGQFDGMVEYPGHSADTRVGEGLRPYGGLIGVSEIVHQRFPTVGGKRKDTELLLVAGDNHSHAFAEFLRDQDSDRFRSLREFWSRLGALQPEAVALWSEDFYRALAPPAKQTKSNAGLFAEWLVRNADMKFLASNAAIRIHRKGLNTIEHEGVTLEIGKDSSIGWESKLSISFGCDRKNLSYTLANGGIVQQDQLTSRGSRGGPCHATIALKSPLVPDQHYTLTVRGTQGADATLQFWTDKALTPGTDRLPLIVPDGPAHLPIIVAMVDPTIRSRLPKRNWEWDKDDPGMTCPGKRCEIVFHDATQAFETIRQWKAARGERYFALLAGMLDPDVLELLYATSAIRFVVLYADTGLLGTSSDEREKGQPGEKAMPPPYSGDAGNIALLDRDQSALARAWIRPQWIGASLPVITAHVARRDAKVPDPPEEPYPSEWDVSALETEAESVRGHRLCAEAEAGSRLVKYFVAEPGEIKEKLSKASLDFHVGEGLLYETYVPDRAYDGRHEQGRLWIDDAEFASLALARMRADLNAEIAIFPRHTVDDDYIAYLAAEHSAGRRLTWLSREIVRRAIFRGDRAVRVKVSGAELAKTLETLLAKGRQFDYTYCAAGLGDTSCSLSKVDADHLHVNGRRIQTDHYYGIAMPSATAAEFGLRFDRTSASLIDLVDAAFAPAYGPVSTCGEPRPPQSERKPAEVPPLSERLEGEAFGRQGFFNLRPVDITGELVAVSEPDGRRATLKGLNVPSSGAQDQHKAAIDSGIDFGYDWRRMTARVIGQAKYGEQRTETEQKDSEQEVITWLVDPDEYRVGPRLDYKLRTTGILWRAYVGYFQEGEFKRERFDSIPEMVRVKRRRHVFGEAGTVLENLIKAERFEFAQLSLALTRGTEHADRRGLLVDGEPQPLPKPTSAKEVVDAYRERFPDRTISEVEFDYRHETKTGFRLDTHFISPIYETYGRKASLSLTVKFRYYWNGPDLLNPEKWNLRIVFEATAPLFRLVNLGVKLDQERIVIGGAEDQPYSIFRGGLVIKLPLFAKRGVGMVW